MSTSFPDFDALSNDGAADASQAVDEVVEEIGGDEGVAEEEAPKGKKGKKAKKPKKAKAKRTTAKSGEAQPRPKSNVYTAMLLVALIALSVACFLLYREMVWAGGNYPWWRPQI